MNSPLRSSWLGASPWLRRFWVVPLALGYWGTAGHAQAQLTVLHTFQDGSVTNDGADPVAQGVIQDSSGTLYGVTFAGGTTGSGIAYKISPLGTYAVLHQFGAAGDGAPHGPLIVGSDGNFWGNCYSPTVVFKMTPSGTVTIVGTTPTIGSIVSPLIEEENNPGKFLFPSGGVPDRVCELDATISTNIITRSIYSFTSTTNGDDPQSGLTRGNDGNYYGTTQSGGTNGYGVIYQLTPPPVNSTNWGFIVLNHFSGSTNSFGANPLSGPLWQATDTNYYGTTSTGGANGAGTVFKMAPTSPWTVTKVHDFGSGTDGATPKDGLIQADDGNFYGTTYIGGTYATGTIYKITPGGVETVIHNFLGSAGGAYPSGTLIQGADGYLYGTTHSGGTAGFGTVYKYRIQKGGLAGGYAHTVAVTSNGNVYTWGYNSNGQLGNGNTTETSSPGLISTNGMTAVAAGYYHSVALKNDGTVWTWGKNSSGQLGNGTTTQSTSPIQVSTNYLSGVSAISAGAYDTVALKTNSTGTGTPYCWGYNGNGQLGNNTTTNCVYPVPVQISGGGLLTNVVSIASGADHHFALTRDGKVYAWGDDTYGQLGDGTAGTTPQKVAEPISALDSTTNRVVSLAAGSLHSLAIKQDGTLWSWGRNGDGQLGLNHTNDVSTPTQITNTISGATIVQVVGGGNDVTLRGFTHALDAAGNRYAWGYNGNGQLGDGNTGIPSSKKVPELVTGAWFTSLGASGNYFGLAVGDHGKVYGWGQNNHGQLGGATDPAATNALISGINLYSN